MINTRQITLYMPGVWGQNSFAELININVDLRNSGLARLLAHGIHRTLSDLCFEAGLCRLFGIETIDGKDLPIAAITHLIDSDGFLGGYFWLRADPVQLVVAQDSIIMMGNCALNISSMECHQLNQDLSGLFYKLGIEILMPHVHRWYLRLDEDPFLYTTSLSAALGKKISSYLPRGPTAQRWKNILNEAQMILHTSNVNQNRILHGKPLINSLWFYGTGRLPARRSIPWCHIWSNETLGQGLAQWAGIKSSAVPITLKEWLKISEIGDHLVVLNEVIEAVSFVDIERWKGLIHAIDEAWFVPLLTALHNNEVQKATIYLGTNLVICITPHMLKRWWRWSKILKP